MNANKATIILPTTKELAENYTKYFTYSKEDYWKKLSPIVKELSTREIIWKGEPDMVKRAEKVAPVVLQKKHSALRKDIEEFFLLIYAGGHNDNFIFSSLLSGKALEIAEKLVAKGALSEESIYDFMGWGKVPKRYSYYNSEDKWKNSSCTAFLATMCHRARGIPDAKYNTDRYSYSVYIVPDSKLISYILDKKLKERAIVDTLPEGLHLFSGSDFAPLAETALGLILSGTVKANKTKVGISAVKKMANMLPIAEFPTCHWQFPSRMELITNMAFFAQNDGKIDEPGKRCSNQEMLKKMYGVLDLKLLLFDTFLISSTVAGMNKDSYYDIGREFLTLATTIKESFKKIPHDKWMPFRKFSMEVSASYASNGYSFLMPSLRHAYPEKLTADGRCIPTSEYKRYYHDSIIESVALAFAALGGLDVAFNDDGDPAYLQLTDLGKWFTGLSDTFPATEIKTSSGPDFTDDPDSGLIIVKNPDSPYLGMLADFADKITDNRYALSKTKFISDCSDALMLHDKINRFKSFIIPNPSAKTTIFLSGLVLDCDKVRKTPGGSTYQLFDVNKEDANLHSVIMSDPEIRKNVMKVEGSRLLIKTSFIPKFISKLKRKGYIISI